MARKLTRKVVAGFAVSMALALPAGAAPGGRATPPDSFVPVAVSDVNALVRQVETNPVVRERYARQLHLPENRVAAYLQANLVKSRLRESGHYTMYFVRSNGLIYPTVVNVPKGSAVFALRGGAPVMSYPDGNPLTLFRVAVETHIIPARPHGAVVSVSPSQQMIAPLQGQEIIVPAYVPTIVYQATPVPSASASNPPAQP